MQRIVFFFSLLFIFSCKTVSVQHETQKTTVNSKILGSVGEQKDFVLEQSYNSITLPKYIKPIKVEAIAVSFSKETFKAFIKSKAVQKTNISINYIDSVKIKPEFVKLELTDIVEVLNSLNNKSNNNIKNYLENKENAHIVTGISLALNKQDLNSIVQADEIFLEHEGLKSYALKTYKNSQLLQTILFNKGVIFAYKASQFCWQEDSKRQLQIVDITESSSCPKRTYKSAKNAKKKIDYFKF